MWMDEIGSDYTHLSKPRLEGRPIQTLGAPFNRALFAIEWASDASDSLIQLQPATGDRSNFSITSPPWRSITQERSPERFRILRAPNQSTGFSTRSAQSHLPDWPLFHGTWPFDWKSFPNLWMVSHHFRCILMLDVPEPPPPVRVVYTAGLRRSHARTISRGIP